MYKCGIVQYIIEGIFDVYICVTLEQWGSQGFLECFFFGFVLKRALT